MKLDRPSFVWCRALTDGSSSVGRRACPEPVEGASLLRPEIPHPPTVHVPVLFIPPAAENNPPSAQNGS